ncbi:MULTISPECIES: SGNH/GDSL hydrolase family protein [Solibacillus]|uniref:SGNH/GDSL hydrolase family protein n=1 Tax=Solibacillus merdavium TaxID=2762218 RepID=A0ABR8XJW0_9BACL|nr:GDSL-type esterase/lipase family protein [Solibacillus merdavium]MBD8032214.1 SGNH/GDSL hydrolase family protein [Solibacillus merdavium]
MKIALIGDSLTEGRPGVSFHTLLEDRFPNITFVNLGKPGETVKSLYTRLLDKNLEGNYDLSFLWIGVNDVYSKLLSVQAQPVAKDNDEFQAYYEKVLELVIASSKKVVTVTPALVGENIDNAPNKEIKELNQLIQSLVLKQSNVSFLDIQSVFFNNLSTVNSSDYISTKVLSVMVDVLFYNKPSRIDKKSKKRGLQLTLDGIHLNSTGAQLVADIYTSEIEQLLKNSQQEVQ